MRFIAGYLIEYRLNGRQRVEDIIFTGKILGFTCKKVHYTFIPENEHHKQIRHRFFILYVKHDPRLITVYQIIRIKLIFKPVF